MEQTLHDLGAILLKSIPTLLLLIVVHLYLKWMFFGPMKKVLDQRRAATEGARQSANRALARASEKATEIEGALRKAREEIYQEQEKSRKRAVDEQSGRIEEARQQAHSLVRQAREQVAQETEAAKRDLSATIQGLADEIAKRLLDRRTAA
jgi:F-type H+-transporting ATPase subunit b